MSVANGYYRNEDGELQAESVPINDIAKRFDTPCYVYSRAILHDNWLAYKKAIGQRGTLCYAVKANGNLGLLSLLARLGAGFDIVSGGELARVLRAGGDASRVIFSGVGKTTQEIRRALLAGIRCFNVESAAELERIEKIAAENHTRAPVALRINPNIDPETHPYISTGLASSKFGIQLTAAEELYRQAARSSSLEVKGVAFHIGSQLMSTRPLREAAERVGEFVAHLQDDGIRIRHVDVGGGLGVSYVDEQAPDPANHVAAVAAPLSELGVELIFEPGRAIVAQAGILLTRVEYFKENGDREFAVVDAGMNDYLRPALYNAEHIIEPCKLRNEEARSIDVVGPICESADVLATECQLAIESGDILAVLCTGAYGSSMASQYNSRPRPAEVLVDGANTHLIRRRETLDDLMRGESVFVGD